MDVSEVTLWNTATHNRIGADLAPCPVFVLACRAQKLAIRRVHDRLGIISREAIYHILFQWWAERASWHVDSIPLILSACDGRMISGCPYPCPTRERDELQGRAERCVRVDDVLKHSTVGRDLLGIVARGCENC